jgi:hypothetical protein
MLVKAAIALAFIWLMLPREPDLGIAGPSPSGAAYSIEHLRQVVLDALIRVITSLKITVVAERSGAFQARPAELPGASCSASSRAFRASARVE